VSAPRDLLSADPALSERVALKEAPKYIRLVAVTAGWPGTGHKGAMLDEHQRVYDRAVELKGRLATGGWMMVAAKNTAKNAPNPEKPRPIVSIAMPPELRDEIDAAAAAAGVSRNAWMLAALEESLGKT